MLACSSEIGNEMFQSHSAFHPLRLLFASSPSSTFRSFSYVFSRTFLCSASATMSSVPIPNIEALRAVIRQGGDVTAALAAMTSAANASRAAALAAMASTATNASSSATAAAAAEVANREGQDDGHEVEDEISYTPYKPTKLKFGRDHPDPVVENATLAAVTPPDISYSEYELSAVASYCDHFYNTNHIIPNPHYTSHCTGHRSCNAFGHNSHGQTVQPSVGGDSLRLPASHDGPTETADAIEPFQPPRH